MNILHHGTFTAYPAEPIIRHGKNVEVRQVTFEKRLWKEAADVCAGWQEQGLRTVAVVCRTEEGAKQAAEKLGELIPISESNLEKAVFSDGVMVLPVTYTKGLEFDAVLILNPDREEYPVDDGHAKLLYVAATRALHELCILHTGNLTGLIADPIPEASKKQAEIAEKTVTVPEKVTAAPEKRAEVPEKVMAAPYKKPVAALKKPAATLKPPQTMLLTGVKPIVPGRSRQERKERLGNGKSFGDMPANEELRPAGHARIDLAMKWVYRQRDGIYLQSRYGVLRISPVKSDVIRVTFVKEGLPQESVHKKIALRGIEKIWMYKENSSVVELLTQELCVQVDKQTGAITFMDKNKKVLLREKAGECRQIDTSGSKKAWNFFDWKKEKGLYAPGSDPAGRLKLKGSARYIQPDTSEKSLPVVISDQGYCLAVATDKPVICCDIPTFGSYLSAEGEEEIDYYFSLIRSSNSIFVS